MQAIYILDSKGECKDYAVFSLIGLSLCALLGKILISRSYRGAVSNNVVSRFVAHLLEEEEVNTKPVRVGFVCCSGDKNGFLVDDAHRIALRW
jgi:hypothetical protein